MKIIRLPTVLAVTGLSRATIYRLMTKKQFPRAIELGPRSCGWIEAEVGEWISQRIEARNQKYNLT
ncbi:MAG: AlpA family transcriptional regulator [Pseudomonadaceae bacterium]